MTELALRLPSILAGAGLSAILFAWLAPSMGRKSALWAATLVLLSKAIVERALEPRMDLLLAFFVTGACACLERALALEGKDRTKVLTGAALCIGLGSLTKSAVGALLPALALGVFLLARRRVRRLVSLDLILAFAAGLSLWLIWIAAAYRVGGRAFFEYQILAGLFSRFFPNAMGGFGTCRSEGYFGLNYVKALLSDYLPWSLYLPASAAVLLIGLGSVPAPVAFAACSFATIFVFFHLSAGRCPEYILPCYPPLAVVFAFLVTQASAEPDALRRGARTLFDLASGTIAVATLVLLSGLGFLMTRSGVSVLSHLHQTDRELLTTLIPPTPSLVLLLTVCGAGAVIVLVGLLRSRRLWAPYGVLAISLATSFVYFNTMIPGLANSRTLKTFAASVGRLVPASEPVNYVGMEVPPCDLRFYLSQAMNRIAPSSFDPGRGHFFLIPDYHLEQLTPRQRDALELLVTGPERAGSRLLFFKAKPGTAPARTSGFAAVEVASSPMRSMAYETVWSSPGLERGNAASCR